MATTARLRAERKQVRRGDPQAAGSGRYAPGEDHRCRAGDVPALVDDAGAYRKSISKVSIGTTKMHDETNL